MPKHVPFRYEPGRPNRVRKVLKFMLHEEEKMLESAQRELMEPKKKAKDEPTPRGRIYFDSIKSKVPGVNRTEAW